jgi:hypothetical protein
MDYLAEWKSRERMMLRRALQDAPAFRLQMPRTASLDRNKLASQLQHLVTVEDDSRIVD